MNKGQWPILTRRTVESLRISAYNSTGHCFNCNSSSSVKFIFLSLRNSSATIFASYATFRIFMSSLPLTVSSSLRTVYPHMILTDLICHHREREREEGARGSEMKKKTGNRKKKGNSFENVHGGRGKYKHLD